MFEVNGKKDPKFWENLGFQNISDFKKQAKDELTKNNVNADVIIYWTGLKNLQQTHKFAVVYFDGLLPD